MSSTPSVDDRPARLSVGVIGAGRVGSVLGAALAQAGHRVVAVSGVSDASRRRADALLPGVPVVPPTEVLEAAELVLLTVPDDVLPSWSPASPPRARCEPAHSWCTPAAGTAWRCWTP